MENEIEDIDLWDDKVIVYLETQEDAIVLDSDDLEQYCIENNYVPLVRVFGDIALMNFDTFLRTDAAKEAIIKYLKYIKNETV